MIALLLVATALIIVVESQWFAVDSSSRSMKRDTATMLARDIMTDLELRMEVEGFGELEVKERGDFNDDHFASNFDDYRWEYEVEKVELDELPNLGMLMGLADDGSDELTQGLNIPGMPSTPQAGAGVGGELAMLEGLGIDLSFFGEMMSQFLREARVRVCYPDGLDDRGAELENCVELTSHLTNPTGQVVDNTEEDEEEEAE
jgi:hypothetical protein